MREGNVSRTLKRASVLENSRVFKKIMSRTKLGFP